MVYIDANVILRYLLNDNADMSAKSRELIAKTKISVRYEVLAEVVYVLSKVYLLSRDKFVKSILEFLSHPNVETESEDALTTALNTYAETNLDFVDCILYGFKAVYGHSIFTFDKQLNSMLNKLA